MDVVVVVDMIRGICEIVLVVGIDRLSTGLAVLLSILNVWNGKEELA